MAGVTDSPFREICRAMGAEYTFSEMISSRAVCHRDKKTAELAAFTEKETPISLQIFGSDPSAMALCAARLSGADPSYRLPLPLPDGIDVNMGCPVPKVVKNGDGSALMRDPARARAVLEAVVRASSLPVSLKIRAGWDAGHVNAPQIASLAEEAGVCAIAVHARTRDMLYGGAADLKVIASVKKAVAIPVIGNGDVASPSDAFRMLESTSCDGLMIGRASCGDPWIFREISSALRGVSYTRPEPEEKIQTALGHLSRLVLLKGEERGVRESRRHMSWYLRGMRGAAALRGKINAAATQEEMRSLLLSCLGRKE